MRFRLEQHFSLPPERVAPAFVDPAFYDAMEGLPTVGRPEVLDRQADGDSVRLRIRYRFTGDLSSAARRVVDPAKLTWVEASTHDLTARRTTFVLHPDHYASRFSCEGGYRFEPEGEGTRRLVEAELRVRFPLVGGAVERALVSGLSDHLANEVEIMERFLAR